MLRSTILALFLTGLISAPLTAQPSLVRDINPAQADTSDIPALGNFTSLGPHAVFTLSRPLEESARSIELWTTDGTDAGTERLLPLADDQGLRLFASKGRIAFFTVVRNQFLHPESSLWRTDGTEAGTFPLASGLGVSPQPAVFVGGSAVFAGCTQDLQRCEPWTSDGTVAGTRRLRDITPGEFGSNPRDFVTAGGFAYFFADAPDGTGLWRTDATPQGTRRVALLPTFSNPRTLIAAGNSTAAGARLYFMMGAGFLPGSGPRASLWTSDGTAAGTRVVPPFDRARGRGPAVAQWIGPLGNSLIFMGVDPVLGWQAYRTDGTPGGTLRLTGFSGEPFSPGGSASLGNRLVFQGPGQKLWTTAGTRASTKALAPLALAPLFGQPVFLVTQGRAVFGGSALGERKDVEPWVTDGTPEGTFKLRDICPGECSAFFTLGTALLGQVQFYVGTGLWGTDGTPEGTRPLARGVILPENQVPALPVPIASVRRQLVFSGFDEDAPRTEFHPELKVTSGSPETTRTLDLVLTSGAGSNPKAFTPVGDDVLFFACSLRGSLWKTDGTPETTIPLSEAGIFCNDPTRPAPIVLDGVAYFLAIAPNQYWREVWRSDGTPAGTYPITSVGPAMDVTALTSLHGELFFFTDVVNGDGRTAVSQLWKSDGTPEGTAEVYELDRRYYNSLTTVGDQMYFVAWLPDEFMRLYVSDGTQAGTRPLTGARAARDFVQLGDETFFLSVDDNGGTFGEVWKTDGTPEGTLQLAPLDHQVESISDLAVYGGRLYFMGADRVDPENFQGTPTLFRSDGTAAGTVPLKAFSLDDPSVFPEFPFPRFAEGAGALFFVAHDEAHGSELWKTDGTAAGTVLVKDVWPGPKSSRIGTIAGSGDRIFFSADDGEHGVELWTSDGTANGTRLVADVAEGPRPSSPREITRIGNRVFFSADDGIVGREPWVLPLDSTLFGRIIQ